MLRQVHVACRAVRDRVFVDAGESLRAGLAPAETATLLHPPLPLVGVSIAVERERQRCDSLVNG